MEIKCYNDRVYVEFPNTLEVERLETPEGIVGKLLVDSPEGLVDSGRELRVSVSSDLPGDWSACDSDFLLLSPEVYRVLLDGDVSRSSLPNGLDVEFSLIPNYD
ncbi:hypothetical protein COU61_03710 [Candidatus Pacearchaeota archaeon CG10_big_fil_rev_8_21_14_0_10_35_13]|nr:MAG: hypothetical protein COU61_03710 [Candidatus Pacearchaeota archaeon CG10_big_fil_rev_8_21_14_0_10_35_13]